MILKPAAGALSTYATQLFLKSSIPFKVLAFGTVCEIRHKGQ
jgi:hypothetical protein